MEFEVTQDFPVGLDQLWDALGRADYVRQKYRSLGSTALHLRKFVADARTIEAELEREAPVAEALVPLWARAFAGRRQTLHHRTRWRRSAPGRVESELEICAAGRRLVANGKGSVVELSPAHSRMTLHFHVESKFPAMKARAAEVFARLVRHALDEDHAFTLEYLEAGARRG